MNKIIAILFLVVGFNLSAQTEFEIYIGPRYPSYGFGDNGLLRFDLDQTSVKKRWKSSSYYIETPIDSLFELFFIDHVTNIDLESFLDSLTEEVTFLRPRIILFQGIGSRRKEILIDENFSVKYDDHIYQLNRLGQAFFLSIMPPDLKENWSLKEKKLKTWSSFEGSPSK